MMLVKLVVILSIVLLGTSGSTSVQPCNESSCRRTCTVDDSCEPETVSFNAECDDYDTWYDNDVDPPEAEDLCTQCCDQNCRIKAFPNCTGENCKKCFEEQSNSTEIYDIHCCEIDGQYRCSLCTMPDLWNADWTTELESQLPDGADFSFDDEDLCGDIPYQGDCVTWDVVVTSAAESCSFTEDDVKCEGWYLSRKTPDCQRCLPSRNKVQFVSSSFERLTVECKAGEAATCEKIPPSILDVFVDCPSTDICELDIKGGFGLAKGVNLTNGPGRQAIGSYGDGETTTLGGSASVTSNLEFPFSLTLNPDSIIFRFDGSGLGPRYNPDAYPEFTDPVTGEIRDHKVCVLSLMAYAKDEQSSATVTMENFQLNAGETATDLGTFSHNSSDVGPTVETFCFDAAESTEFTGVVKVEGDFRESGDRWSVLLQCGTVPRNNCMFEPQN